ncbi:hypothetical protein SORBI_3009G017666 [Sorghum bicolor]|uniref:Uncharacterized protein n=1 Tax=Sorghum bicolor TaxID=4558 RepID=A0A1B6P5X6_SORBI|nr:hypothetical protein SORBI_3009G017666 [Sorghum bicolor]
MGRQGSNSAGEPGGRPPPFPHLSHGRPLRHGVAWPAHSAWPPSATVTAPSAREFLQPDGVALLFLDPSTCWSWSSLNSLH